MCINGVCNRYGRLVSGFAMGRSVWALMCVWSIPGSILPFAEGLFPLWSWNESPLSFCRRSSKLAKYGGEWNLKGGCVSVWMALQSRKWKILPVSPISLRYCFDKRLCSGFLGSFKAQKSFFLKAITGEVIFFIYFQTGCLDDNSSLVTVLKMWLDPFAFTLISTHVSSGSLQETLQKVWQGLKILLPLREIWHLLIRLPACTSSHEKFSSENEGHH